MKIWRRIACSMLLLMSVVPAIAAAANAIQKIQVRRDGENVLVKLEMQDPLKVAP